MHLLIQDFRYALRSLRNNLGLTIAVVLSLAIGIGANSAIFSVVNGLLLRPLPYPDPDRLAIFWLRSPGVGIPQDWPSPGEYIDIKTQNHVFEEMAIAIGDTFNLTRPSEPERIEGIRASSALFSLLGAKPLLGRTLLPEEDVPGKPRVAILTYGLWKRLFGADPQILGKSIVLDGQRFTVAGILRPDFLLNHEVMPTVAAIDKVEIILPLPLGADAQKDRRNENFNIMARLKPGVSVREAQADIDIIASRIREQDRRDRTFTISVVPLLDQVVGDVRRTVLVLFGSVALVLLIACANVANLLLSRATARQKEMAIRGALGAGKGQIVRQLLTESVMLGLLGGAAGMMVAVWALAGLRALNPGNIPRLEQIGIDPSVVAFTFGVSILTGIVFGMAPAIRIARIELNDALKVGGRSSRDESGFAVARHGLRSLLVVGQLALSLMLLIGAGLLVRSFASLQAVPPGFNPDHVISMRLSLAGPEYREPKARGQFFEELGARIGRLPGVRLQGAVSALPFTSSVGWGSLIVEGYTPPPNQELQVDLRAATPDYFRAMEIPLQKGRFFSEHDTSDALQVVLVDEKMANRFWPHDDPIGKRVRQGPQSPWYTIVGVVGNVKQYGLEIDGRPVVYFPHKQATFGGMYIVARTSSDAAAMAGSIIQEVHAQDPNIPVYNVGTMTERLHNSLARQRFSMIMLGGFAGLALILAGLGVYGVMSYLVTQSTHDIGIRIALGAPQNNILGFVVRQGMSLAAVGIVIGLAAAFGLTRVMASLLFGVSATDSVTFSLVALFLAGAALLACYVPARRATKVDPINALRYE